MYQFDGMIDGARAVPETASPLIAGNSVSAQSLRQLLALAASSADPVLITGPVGAGKHTLATVIHAHSPRSTCPFIKASGSSFDTDQLSAQWKGTYYLRPGDHQALVPMYVAQLTNLDDPDQKYYELLSEVSAFDAAPPCALPEAYVDRCALNDEFMAAQMEAQPSS